MKQQPKVLTTTLALFALGACSGIPQRTSDQEALDRYLQYAGEPVSSVSFPDRFDSWRSLGRDKLVVWRNINEAYLLSVAGPCSDLPFATRIGLKTTTGSMLTRGDSVLLPHRQRCLITEIRPIDYRKMKEDARQPGSS